MKDQHWKETGRTTPTQGKQQTDKAYWSHGFTETWMVQQLKTNNNKFTHPTHLWTKRHGELLFGFAELNRSLSVIIRGKNQKGRGRGRGHACLRLDECLKKRRKENSVIHLNQNCSQKQNVNRNLKIVAKYSIANEFVLVT